MERNSIRQILNVEEGRGETAPDNVERSSVCANCFQRFTHFTHAEGGHLGYFFALKTPIEHTNEMFIFFSKYVVHCTFSFTIFLEFNSNVIVSPIQQNIL